MILDIPGYLHVVYMVDSSSDVPTSRFNEIMSYIKSHIMTLALHKSKTLVTVISYGSTESLIEGKNLNILQNDIDNLKKSNGASNLKMALQDVKRTFNRKPFPSTHGKLLIIFHNDHLTSEQKLNTENLLTYLRANGIQIIAVGFAGKPDVQDLTLLSGAEDQTVSINNVKDINDVLPVSSKVIASLTGIYIIVDHT